VAHLFGVGMNFELLPFKGLYWKLDPESGIRVQRLIYPVPDLRVPFLGVHTTTSTEGAVYLGPTAVPAFGRENYHGLEDVRPSEFTRITLRLTAQFATGRDGFRRLAAQEGRRYFKPWFVDAARALLPRLESRHLLPCDKVGIRAQLLNRETGRLVNDFVVQRGPSSTHVLNAISPAWTSAFPFARFVVDSYIQN
jgi:L-2-hydroxyglutarate oxidase